MEMAGGLRTPGRWAQLITVVLLVAVGAPAAQAQLNPLYYAFTCPSVELIVAQQLAIALNSDFRVGASILRMHFHDCFVQGCDASILLVDTPTFQGEQNARPNGGSLRGYGVIDQIKAAVEAKCPGVVSCADILAITARDAVLAAGGAPWILGLGRKDSLTASFAGANNNLPSPFSNVATLTSSFNNVGLSQIDMVILSGAHTFGKAQCATFRNRLYNFSNGLPDPTIGADILATFQAACPQAGDPTQTAFLDNTTPMKFDPNYFGNLEIGHGVLTSDQTLKSEGGFTGTLVDYYARNPFLFYAQFVISMIKMSNISPLTGNQGQVRKDCKFVNP